jgi:hypothetical protein
MVEQLVAKFKNVVISLQCTNTLHLIKLILICINIDVGLWICSHVPTQITLHYLVQNSKLLPSPILIMEGILPNKPIIKQTIYMITIIEAHTYLK